MNKLQSLSFSAPARGLMIAALLVAGCTSESSPKALVDSVSTECDSADCENESTGTQQTEGGEQTEGSPDTTQTDPDSTTEQGDSGTSQSGGEESATDLGLTEDGSTVLVGDSWRACETNLDCVTVNTSCDGCCGEDAVSATLQMSYQDEFAELCEDYSGGVCDCIALPADTQCLQGLCQRVTRPETCPPCVPPPPGCEGTGTGPCGCGPYVCDNEEEVPRP